MSSEQRQNPLDAIDLDSLFASINNEYKRGGKFVSGATLNNSAESSASFGRDLSASHIAKFMTERLSRKPFEQLVRNGEDIRRIAGYFNHEFEDWQVNAHLYTNNKEDEEAIRRITLDDMAYFARDRHEEFAKQSGRAIPDSQDYKSLQERADYWAWAGQVVDEAIAQNKTNR